MISLRNLSPAVAFTGVLGQRYKTGEQRGVVIDGRPLAPVGR